MFLTDFPYDAMMDSSQSTILAADFPHCPRDSGFMRRRRMPQGRRKENHIMREADKADQNPGGIDQTAEDTSAKSPGGRNTRDKEESGSRKPASGITSKQVVAIIGIILLVLLYIVALIAAIADTSSSGRLFMLCLFATVAIPILIWIYTWMYGKLRNRHTFADFRTKEQMQGDSPIPKENPEQED